mgnify:CR=1 FL=1
MDTLFSRYIRLRDGGRCVYCGKIGDVRGMHTHHFRGRRYKRTRYEEDNAACLCYACHNLMSDFSEINTSLHIKLVGSDRVEALGIRARSSNVTIDREEIKKKLQEKIKALELEEFWSDLL